MVYSLTRSTYHFRLKKVEKAAYANGPAYFDVPKLTRVLRLKSKLINSKLKQ